MARSEVGVLVVIGCRRQGAITVIVLLILAERSCWSDRYVLKPFRLKLVVVLLVVAVFVPVVLLMVMVFVEEGE